MSPSNRRQKKSRLRDRVLSYLRNMAALTRLGVAFSALAALLIFGVSLWPNLSYMLQRETTGTIFVDSPEVYTRERLVNDRYIQDAWLRDKLKELNTIAPTIQLETINSTIAALSAKGINTADVKKALEDALSSNTTIGPGREFRLHNAVRELVRQEIVENQLDDRHDFAGNTMFLLKFDTAVVPGANTSKNALIEVRITSPSQNQSTDDESNPDLEWIEDYYRTIEKQALSDSKFKWAWKLFDDWTRNLELRISTRSQAIYAEILNPNITDQRSLDAFLDFLLSFQDQLKLAPFDECGSALSDLVGIHKRDSTGIMRKQAIETLQCYLIDANGRKAIRPYLSIFSTKSAVEREVGEKITSRVYLSISSPGSGRENSVGLAGAATFLFDGPFSYETQIIQDDNPRSPPQVKMVDPGAAGFAIEQRCYASIIPLAEKQREQVRSREVIFNAVHFLQNGSTGYVLTQIPKIRRLLNDDVLDSTGGALAIDQRVYNEVFHIHLADGNLSGEPFVKQFNDYLKSRMSDPTGLSSDNDRTKFNELYSPIDAAIRNEKCGGLLFHVPITYFDFVNRLTKPVPFSYAVLPKYEADIESIEFGSSRELALSNLLSSALSKVGLDQDLTAQIASFSASKQTRPRTTLIGFGYQEDPVNPVDAGAGSGGGYPSSRRGSEGVSLLWGDDRKEKAGALPVFGWLIAPDRSIELAMDNLRFQPLQKSLSALVSIPSWWTEITVHVETNWLGMDGIVEYPKCSDRKKAKRAVVSGCYEYKISLPSDMQLLDELIVKTPSRGPSIDPLDVPRTIYVQQCRPARIAIPGNRLWRSATVTLGGQEAKRIVVMPNMRGIVAEFDRIEANESQPKLMIWTSTGAVKFPADVSVDRADDSCLKSESKAQSDSASTGK